MTTGLGVRTHAQQIGDGTQRVPRTPGFCWCGCGRVTPLAMRSRSGDVRGQPRRYFGNHGHRPLSPRPLLQKASNGRTFIRGRDGSRDYWYRIVARNVLGRELQQHEIVHHIDGDITNDRPDNLAVISRADHPRVHYATVPLEVEAIA